MAISTPAMLESTDVEICRLTPIQQVKNPTKMTILGPANGPEMQKKFHLGSQKWPKT